MLDNPINQQRITNRNRRFRGQRQQQNMEEDTQQYTNIPNSVMTVLRNHDTEENCTICTEPLERDLTVTHCNHVFHSNCLHMWMESNQNRNPTCPVCRTSLEDQEQEQEQEQAQERNGVQIRMDVLRVDRDNMDNLQEAVTEAIQNLFVDA